MDDKDYEDELRTLRSIALSTMKSKVVKTVNNEIKIKPGFLEGQDSKHIKNTPQYKTTLDDSGSSRIPTSFKRKKTNDNYDLQDHNYCKIMKVDVSLPKDKISKKDKSVQVNKIKLKPRTLKYDKMVNTNNISTLYKNCMNDVTKMMKEVNITQNSDLDILLIHDIEDETFINNEAQILGYIE